VAPHFRFGEEVHPEAVSGTTAVSALLGLSVHSFFDGITIGSGFLIGRPLGLLLFSAIVLHKAPEGFAIASVTLAAGGRRERALGAAATIGAASLARGLAMFWLDLAARPPPALSSGLALPVPAPH